MRLKSIPRRLGYILGAQWTRDVSWAVFTILLARRSPDILGQIVLALTYGYLVKTVADVGLNDFLVSTFARGEGRPRTLLGEVTWLKLIILILALGFAWFFARWQGYGSGLQVIILCIAGGLGLDAISDSFFALCQVRGRQDVEMLVRVPASLIGIGFGITAIALDWPPIAIALYKPIESLLLIIFSLYALGRNPLAKVSLDDMRDLARKMKSGLIFTGMAACAMFYNKINIIFLKKYGGLADVANYGVAWETIEGLSVLISSALLGKVIFPMLAKLWKENREAFQLLAGQTARTLWAASLPLIYLICVESDRFLPLIYGPKYLGATVAQQVLTPCLATAFLHNLAAYVMIGMNKPKLLFSFYLSGLLLNIFCCVTIIPRIPLTGAALSLTITKVWVAILTVSYFQWKARPMSGPQWSIMLLAICASASIWYFSSSLVRIPREICELAGVCPLMALFWAWRPPSLFERSQA